MRPSNRHPQSETANEYTRFSGVDLWVSLLETWCEWVETLKLLGLKHLATIFFNATQNRPRHNYFPEVENYFRLYFQRHVR